MKEEMKMDNNRDFDESKMSNFNLFQPTNQLPYPAVAGQVLLTKSDFTFPARPDLMVWKNLEEVIGVEDIRLIFDPEFITAELQKLVNNVWISVGVIGNVSPQDAEKLRKTHYIKYYLQEDATTHKLKLLGELPDPDQALVVISSVDFVNYADFMAKYTQIQNELAEHEGKLQQHTATLEDMRGELDSHDNHLQYIDTAMGELTGIVTGHTTQISQINTHLENVDTHLQVLDATTEQHTQQINAQAETIASIIAQQGETTQEIESLTQRIYAVELNQNNIILPIVNKLREVANPLTILSKKSDGVGIEWRAMLGLDSIRLALDNVRNVITLYQTINGVETSVGEWDNINRGELVAINMALIPIANNLNEHSEPFDILTKTSDGLHYSWKEAGFIIKAEKTLDTETGIYTITFKLIDDELVTFDIPSAEYLQAILDRLATLENKVATIETEQVAQNARLDDIEEWQEDYKPIEALAFT